MLGSPFLDPVAPLPAPPEARWAWAVVTQSSPLRIRMDGDLVALGITPDDMGGAGTRPIGQRVYCQILNRRLVVVGPTIGGLPSGSVTAFAGATLPAGHLWCTGAAVSRFTYAALFAAIGTLYGVGDNWTTFNLPNMFGRVPVMTDNSADFTYHGKAGGARTHILTTAELAAHAHGVYDPGHSHSARQPYKLGGDPVASGEGLTGSGSPAYPTPGVYNGVPGFTTGSSVTGIGIYNEGGGAAHNNLQPYLCMNYIIKI